MPAYISTGRRVGDDAPICTDAGCDIDGVPELRPFESRAAWVARVQDWYDAQRYPLTAWEMRHQEQAERERAFWASYPQRACDRCGQSRAVNGPCIGCTARRRHQRGVA